MRAIPPTLQEKLDSGVTTLCRCWIVRRRDGAVQGFTDHDCDVAVDGVACRADTGVSGSEVGQSFGMSVGGSEMFGALSADTLNEDDLAAGLYDAAEVSLHLVDWSAPHLHVLLAAGVVGDIRRKGAAFSAEVRGAAHRLAEPSGRLYTPACGADLGDARCRVDLGHAALRGVGTAADAGSASAFMAAGLGAFADGWFTAGRLAFTGGANAGIAVEVKSHRTSTDGVRIALWQAMPHPVAGGDAFTVTAGCDKRFATCRDRFGNAANFRGFPHIPGNDFVMRYPVPGEPGNGGGSFGRS